MRWGIRSFVGALRCSERAKAPRTGELGQGLVELALTLPLLVMIIVATADIGRVFYVCIAVSGAAHKAALYCSVHPTDVAGCTEAALADASTLFDGVPTVSPVVKTIAGQQAIVVTVSHTFRPLFPYPGLPGNLVVSRSVTMRVKP